VPSASSVRFARRLLAHGASENGQSPSAVGAALQRTVSRLSEALRDSIGDDGCQALLVRALAQAEKDHPLLNSVLRNEQDVIHFNGVAASVEKHGAAQVASAVEALVAVIVDVLARLIGEDMAIQIIDGDPPKSRKRGGVEP
jgi:hypothetical protein